MQEKFNLNKEDIEVLKFISKYKMLKVEDASLIYKTKRYYRQRINRLILKDYIKRYKSYIIISKNGRKFLNEVGSLYIKNMHNESFMERLKNIASIATISINSNINFIPSWDIKERDKYTETSRRYIGKMNILNNDYLIYYLSSKKEHVYIKQLIFDINKSINHDEIIVFVDNYDIISKRYSNLSFGKQKTLVIKNTRINKELLKKYEYIDFHEIIEEMYDREVLISNWDLADFYLEDNIYIINMPFINTEIIEQLNYYYMENGALNKKIEIWTLEENKEKLKELLANKCIVKTFDYNKLMEVNDV